MVAALSQQSFLSTGPIGISSEYIRNSLMPNFHCQLRGYKGAFFCGIAGDVLRLVPRLVSDKNVKVNEHIVSFRGEAFASWTYPSWSLRTKVLYAQNGNDLLLISGFGVHTVDPKTDFRTYTNTACAAAWVDASYFFYNDTMELGLFAGGTKNLGSVRSLFIDPATQEPIIYTLVDIAKDLSYVARISPRYAFVKDPVRFGLEIEYTRAAFGKARKNGQIAHTRPVNNVRVLAALYYVF
jgi:hypothetical protein